VSFGPVKRVQGRVTEVLRGLLSPHSPDDALILATRAAIQI
jgi:hypothetical protein